MTGESHIFLPEATLASHVPTKKGTLVIRTQGVSITFLMFVKHHVGVNLDGTIHVLLLMNDVKK